LANDELATPHQIECACAAISNMAAVVDNQQLLCKAGAIGILNRIEIELEGTNAACANHHVYYLF
jgi:hypothetical protein